MFIVFDYFKQVKFFCLIICRHLEIIVYDSFILSILYLDFYVNLTFIIATIQVSWFAIWDQYLYAILYLIETVRSDFLNCNWYSFFLGFAIILKFYSYFKVIVQCEFYYHLWFIYSNFSAQLLIFIFHFSHNLFTLNIFVSCFQSNY